MRTSYVLFVAALLAIAFGAVTKITSLTFEGFAREYSQMKVHLNRTIDDATYKMKIIKTTDVDAACPASGDIDVDYIIATNTVEITTQFKAVLTNTDVEDDQATFIVCYLSDPDDGTVVGRYPESGLMTADGLVPTFDYSTHTLTLSFSDKVKIPATTVVSVETDSNALIMTNNVLTKTAAKEIGKFEFAADTASPVKIPFPFMIPAGANFSLKYATNGVTPMGFGIENGSPEYYDKATAVDTGAFVRTSGNNYEINTPTGTELINVPLPQVPEGHFGNMHGGKIVRECVGSNPYACQLSVAADYDTDVFGVEINVDAASYKSTATISIYKPFTQLPELAFTVRKTDETVGDAEEYFITEDISVEINTYAGADANTMKVHSFDLKTKTSQITFRQAKVGPASGATHKYGNTSNGYIVIPFTPNTEFKDLKLTTAADADATCVTLGETSFTFGDMPTDESTDSLDKYISFSVSGCDAAQTLAKLAATVTHSGDYVYSNEWDDVTTMAGTLVVDSNANATTTVPFTNDLALTISTDATTKLSELEIPITNDLTGFDSAKLYAGFSKAQAMVDGFEFDVTLNADKATGGKTAKTYFPYRDIAIAFCLKGYSAGVLKYVNCVENITIVGALGTVKSAVIDLTENAETLTITVEDGITGGARGVINAKFDEDDTDFDIQSTSATVGVVHLKDLTCIECTIGYTFDNSTLTMKKDDDTVVANFTNLPKAPKATYISTALGDKVTGKVLVEVPGKTVPDGSDGSTSNGMSDELFLKVFANKFTMGVKTTACPSTNGGLTSVPTIGFEGMEFDFTADYATTYNICYCYGADSCGTAGVFTTNAKEPEYPTLVDSVIAPAGLTATVATVTLDKDIPVNSVLRAAAIPKTDTACPSTMDIVNPNGAKTFQIDLFETTGEQRFCFKFDDKAAVLGANDKVAEYTNKFAGKFTKDGDLLKFEMTTPLPNTHTVEIVMDDAVSYTADLGTAVTTDVANVVDDPATNPIGADTGKLTGIAHDGSCTWAAVSTFIALDPIKSVHIFISDGAAVEVTDVRFFKGDHDSPAAAIAALVPPVPKAAIATPAADERFIKNGDNAVVIGVDGPTKKKLDNILIPKIPATVMTKMNTVDSTATVTRTCVVTSGYTCKLKTFDTTAANNGAIETQAVTCDGTADNCTFLVSDTEPAMGVAVQLNGNDVVLTEEVTVTVSTKVSGGASKIPDDTVIDTMSADILPKDYTVNFGIVGAGDEVTKKEYDVVVSISRPVSTGKTVKINNIKAVGAKATVTPNNVTFTDTVNSFTVKVTHDEDTAAEILTGFTIDSAATTEDPRFKIFTATPNTVSSANLTAVPKGSTGGGGSGGGNDNDGLSTGTIALIAVGVILVIGAVVAVVMMKGKKSSGKVKPVNKHSVKENVEFAES